MKKILLILYIALSATMAWAGNDSYYFQKAEEAYQKEDFDRCLRYCQAGVADNPKDGKCWAVIAEIYSKRAYARYAESLEAADKALATLPKKESYWRAFVHNIRGNVYYKIEDLPASKEAYKMAVSIKPDNMSFWYELADVCFELKQYEEAVTCYLKCVEISPKTVYVYGDLAYAYYHLGDTVQAQKYCDLTNALSKGENNTAHRVLARLALDRGDRVTACREMTEAMFLGKGWCSEADTLNRLCPDLLLAAIRCKVAKAQTDVETNAVAAYCCYSMRRYFETLYYLHKKLEQSDSPQDIYPELGSVYDDVDAFDEAEHYYQLALKNDSSDVIWGNLATVARHKGDHAKAEQLYRRAFKEDPTEGMYLYWIALCRRELGDYQGALQTVDSAQLLLDDDRQLMMICLQADIYRLMGDETRMQQALKQAQRMREAGDKRSEFYMVDALSGDTAKMAQVTDSLLKDPQVKPGNLLSMANAYARIQDTEHVTKLFQRYFERGEYAMFTPRTTARYAYLKDDKAFNTMLAHYDSLRLEDLAALKRRISGRDSLQQITELPFTQQDGINRVKCTINGLPLYFVFDTGAADVSISSVEANFMLKNGYLTNADFLGKQNYVTATGEIHEGTVINLREVRVGDVVLRDIKASVIKNQFAPLLLGQSCFRRFGTVEVDNKAHVIRLIAQ